ncbi:MAG TPA: hypothetical protein PKC24_09595 [Cyclobacteriaceae bacterium]|nr:hypothetical protein [Cyclobacteriaceae bacterium]
MKIVNSSFIILITTILSGIIGCKGIQLISLENARQFQLERNKNELVKWDEELEKGRMQWNKKQDDCISEYSFGNEVYCLKYLRRPEYAVEIFQNNQKMGRISKIKKHESILEIANATYSLRPNRGSIVAFLHERPIARIYQSKGKWQLEVINEYEQNNLLLAALIYKDWEWQKNNQSSDGLLLWIALLPVFM